MLDCQGIDAANVQAIAAEFHLSESTFLLLPSIPDPSRSTEDAAHEVRFRWFAPGMEVDVWGHATITGVRALPLPRAEGAHTVRPGSGEADQAASPNPKEPKLRAYRWGWCCVVSSWYQPISKGSMVAWRRLG